MHRSAWERRFRHTRARSSLRGRPINVTLHVASVRHTHYAPMCLQEHSCRGVMKRVLCEPAHDDDPSTPENSFVFGTGFGRAVGERLVLCNRLRSFVLQVSTNALQWHIDKVSIMTPTLGWGQHFTVYNVYNASCIMCVVFIEQTNITITSNKLIVIWLYVYFENYVA